MDLEQFKNAWRDEEIVPSAHEEKSMSQIQAMVADNVRTQMNSQMKRYQFTMVRMVALAMIVLVGFYSMSDGFTNAADPIGPLFVLLGLLMALFFAAWSRQRELVGIAASVGSDIHANLPQAIALLRRNLKVELGAAIGLSAMAAVGWALSGGGTFALSALVSLAVVAFAAVAYIWRRAQLRLTELNGYLDQLNEV